MGLGLSVELIGDSLTGEKDKHIVTEGLALGLTYILVRTILLRYASQTDVAEGILEG